MSSERNDLSVDDAADVSISMPEGVTPLLQPALTPPPVPATPSLADGLKALPVPEDEARARLTSLEREVKALGSDPAAALVFHEIGLLWEDPLKNPRNAAVAFQNAFRLAPRHVPNIRAARRLFADVGNWQMVVQLLDAELAACDDARQRAALLLEKASVLEERLSRDADALATYRACLELSPTDVAVLVQLEGVYAAKQDYARLVDVDLLLARVVEEPPVRAHYLTTAGYLLEDRLKDPDRAAAAFRSAFELDRKDVLLLGAIKRVAEREGTTDELLAALAAEAEVLGANAAPAYLQISKVYEKLDRREDALAALLAARRAANDPLILAELARIYEAQRRFEDLADTLLSWAAAINDESEFVAINLRLASLYEEELKRDEDAIGRYRAVLERVPNHAQALAGLGKLYFRTQNWEGLLGVFELEVNAAEDARQKAAKTYKAAEVLEERLARVEEAITRYNQCLQLQPGYLPAQKALTRLYEKQNRYAELIAMYEQDLLQTPDREQVLSTLNKIASIYEDRLNDLDHAIDCMNRILDLQPDHMPTIRNLARLLEAAGRWRELIEHHDREAALVGDTRQVLSLHHRNAEILEEQLGDRAGATHAYERLLTLSPSYLPALRALGRLYAQESRWQDLIKMYRAESEISASTENAAALLYKVGELQEHRLQDEGAAVASYQEVLTLAPNYFPALQALARIYRSHSAWESLIDVLHAEAANRTDPIQRANAVFHAASIWEDHLGRVDMAIAGYQECLRLTPGHATALRALERLYTQQGNTKELIAVLDRETQTSPTPAGKVAAYLKLLRLYLDRLNEPGRAAQCCEAVLALDSGNVAALKALERIRATDRPRRAEVRARLATRVQDSRLRTALRIAAASDRDRGVNEVLLAELQRAHGEDPSDTRTSFALERALRLAADHAGLARLYEERGPAVTDPSERLELALRLGELYETRLGDLHGASRAYAVALEQSPGFLPALQGARRVAIRLGDWAAARALHEAEGKSARDVRTALEAFVGAARAAEQLGDTEGAIASYRRALERDPLDPTASSGLEELLAKSGGDAELAALHERRGEAKLAQRDLLAAAREFFGASKLWLDKLGQPDRALAALERALAAQPGHPEALELKARLCLDARQYAEAAGALSARVQQGGDARILSGIHLQLGALYQEQLGELSRAAAHLQTSIATDPGNVEALERLATIHTQSRNWTGAADCLKRLCELTLDLSQLARHTLSLARIIDEGFADPQQASALYRRALELAPGDMSVIDRLVALHEKTGNLSELVELLEAQANVAQQVGEQDRSTTLRLRVGDLYARTMQNPTRGIGVYRQVVEQDPQNVEAHAALADLYMRDAAAGPLAIQEHLQVLRLDPTRLDSLHALFRLWEGLRQTDKAFCVAGILAFYRAINEVEVSFYNELRNKLPADRTEPMSGADLDQLQTHGARTALAEVVRAIGDQVSKLYPPALEALGVDRKQDRLKPDHAVFKAIRGVAQVLGVEEFEVYQARRGLVTLETTEPLSICVSGEVIRRFNAREQKFLFARAALGLANRTAILTKLSAGEAADLIGNSIRIHQANFNGLGRRNDETTKALRRAYSRKALRALEGPSLALAGTSGHDVKELVSALQTSANRAGTLLCGDVGVALSMLLRDDANMSIAKGEGSEPIREAVTHRDDVKAMIQYVLSDEFFRLRARTGVAVS